MNPSDWFTAAMAARIAHRANDDSTASAYATWGNIVQGDSAPSVIMEASVVPAPIDDVWAGLPSNYPWSTYLRPDAPFLALPELTLIGLR
jgi:hypothetical protein